ncbi:hypothetical protein GCM10010341_05610 [Streptomyces noursei]|nr:hypothetical protein GCM10010341_05610 [Streptomyces noursei]
MGLAGALVGGWLLAGVLVAFVGGASWAGHGLSSGGWACGEGAPPCGAGESSHVLTMADAGPARGSWSKAVDDGPIVDNGVTPAGREMVRVARCIARPVHF